MSEATLKATTNAVLKALAARGHSEFLASDKPHSEAELLRYCKERGIFVADWDLPEGCSGMSLELAGTPTIVIDAKITDRTNRTFVLAHEIAHTALGHIEGTNPVQAYAGCLEDIDQQKLLQAYWQDKELEANVGAFQLLFPRPFLDRIVEQHIYIPVARLAASLDLNRQLLAGRVELYRRTVGYQRSEELRALRYEGTSYAGDALSRGSARTIELTECGHLDFILRNSSVE